MRRNDRAPAFLARGVILAAIGILAAQAAILLVMGQPAICACGYVKLWHGLPSSPETSQHVSDWYTFSHVLHGIVFYAALRFLFPRALAGALFIAAFAVEAAWEVVENTPFIIDRYRQLALAQGYFGDSVVNSLFDTLAAASGVAIARLAPVWITALTFAAIEAALAFAIRDNLALNVIQLIHPFEAITRWQTGG